LDKSFSKKYLFIVEVIELDCQPWQRITLVKVLRKKNCEA